MKTVLYSFGIFLIFAVSFLFGCSLKEDKAPDHVNQIFNIYKKDLVAKSDPGTGMDFIAAFNSARHATPHDHSTFYLTNTVAMLNLISDENIVRIIQFYPDENDQTVIFSRRDYDEKRFITNIKWPDFLAAIQNIHPLLENGPS